MGVRSKIAMIAVIAATAVGSLSYPGVATAKPGPTLTATALCFTAPGPGGVLVAQVNLEGTGWPPNTFVRVKALTGALAGFSIPILADAAGDFTFNGPALTVPWGFSTAEALVDTNHDGQVDPGEPYAITRLDNPCRAPTLTKESCKNGGWAELFFKNQGECVAFVAREPKT